MAQSAPDQARYLQDALAIAAGTQHATPEEFARLQALARLAENLLNALVWLEDIASSMPEHLYDQAGINGAVLHARIVIHQANGLTRSDEEQVNLARERDAHEIASEFMDVLVSQGPHGVFSTETDEDLPRSPTQSVSLQEEIDRS